MRANEMPRFYKFIIIPLHVELKDTWFYKIESSSHSIEPGALDMFPFKVLAYAKDPIVGMIEIYQYLKDSLSDGTIQALLDNLEVDQTVTTDMLFKLAGIEMGEILESIRNIFGEWHEELEHYNMAKIVTGGILIASVRDLGDADVL